MKIEFEQSEDAADGFVLLLMPHPDTFQHDCEILAQLDQWGRLDTLAKLPEDFSELPFSDFVFVEYPHGPYEPPEYTGDTDYDPDSLPNHKNCNQFLRNLARTLNDPTPEEIHDGTHALTEHLDLNVIQAVPDHLK